MIHHHQTFYKDITNTIIPMLVINQLMQIQTIMLITKEFIVMEYIVWAIVIMEDQL